MALDELLPIPDIPVEIVRIIFETLAIMSRPDALNLVLISKAVRKWIDVILYHSVTIVSFSQFNAFLRAIQYRALAGDTSFIAVTVKYLFLKFPLDARWQHGSFDARRVVKEVKLTAGALVAACSGLVALGLRDSAGDASILTAVLKRSPGLRLKRLSLSHWGENSALKHLPSTLTHLRYPCGTLPVALLRTVPGLTHLHVSIGPLDHRTLGEVREVVEGMPETIEVCVFTYDGNLMWPEEPGRGGIRDPRVAVLGILEEDMERYGSSWSEVSQDCGFLRDGQLDSWEIFDELVKGRGEKTK